MAYIDIAAFSDEDDLDQTCQDCHKQKISDDYDCKNLQTSDEKVSAACFAAADAKLKQCLTALKCDQTAPTQKSSDRVLIEALLGIGVAYLLVSAFA